VTVSREGAKASCWACLDLRGERERTFEEASKETSDGITTRAWRSQEKRRKRKTREAESTDASIRGGLPRSVR